MTDRTTRLVLAGVWLVLTGWIIALLWPLLAEPGFIGFRHDWGINPFSLEGSRELLLSAWQRGGLGGPTTFGTDVLARVVSTVVSYTDLSSRAWNNGLVVVALAGAALAMSAFLTRIVRLSPLPVFVGSALYALSPLVYDRLLLGYLWYLLAYALLPLYLWTSFAFLERTHWSWRHAAGSALVYVTLGMQIHFLIIAPVVFLLGAAVLGQARRALPLALFHGVAGFGANAFWFIPLVTSDGSLQAISSSATVTDWVSSRSTPSWLQRLTLTNHPNQYAATLLRSNTGYLVGLLGAMGLAWLGGIVRSNYQRWATVGIATILFGLGVVSVLTPPFAPGVEWLFAHVPVVRMFREPVHWMGAVAFGMGVAGAIGLQGLLTRPAGVLRALSAASGVALVVLASTPFWHGELATQLKPVVVHPDYQRLNRQQQQVEGRAFWWPAIGPFHYPGSSASINFDPVIESFAQPSFPTEGGRLFYGGRATQLRNYTIDRLVEGDLALSGILKRVGVRDLFLREDVTSSYSGISSLGDFRDAVDRLSGHRIGDRLRAVPGIQLDSSTPTVGHFTTRRPTDSVAIATRPIATGEDLGGLRRTNDAVFFLDPVVTSLVQTKQIPLADDEVSIQEAALFAQATERIEPGPYAGAHFDARAGWTRALYWWWRDPFVAAAREQAVIAEADDVLTLPLSPSREPTTLWLKVSAFSPGTVLDVSAGGASATLEPKLKQWEWVPALTVPAHDQSVEVALRATAGAPLVANLITTTSATLNPLSTTSTSITPAVATIISSRTVSPTDYRLNIRAATPFWLVLRQSFHPGWSAVVSTPGQSEATAAPVLVDGYANAFYIDTLGDLSVRIEYRPQRFHTLGLTFSLATLAALAIALVIAPRLPRHLLLSRRT